MKKTILEQVTVVIKTLEPDKIKQILWQLYYLPEEAYKQLDIEGIAEFSRNDLVEHILGVCEASNISLYFGKAQPFVSTEGVDLGIKFPVVRDAILERCHAAVFDEEHCIEKAIKLLKTDSELELADRRLFGGLKEIGFSNKEASYLKDSCNLYPVSLILERLLDKAKIQEQTEIVEEVIFDENKPVLEEETVEKNEAPEDKLKGLLKFIANEEKVKNFYLCMNNRKENSKANVEATIAFYKKELEKLEKALEILSELEEQGITFDELINKEAELKAFLKLVKEL